MKTALFVLLGLVALLAVVALVLQIAGARMPREHRSVVSATFTASRAVVWAALTDYAAMPTWWPAVKSIRFEKLPDGTELTWNKDGHGNEIPFRTAESRAPEKLVRVIASERAPKLPFGGTWTFSLAEAPGGGTTLTIIEDGFIEPAFFRAVATWFMGLDATQKDCLAQLGKHLAKK
ncbi:MAG: hypothetical protein RLZZ15_3417 [Verrucomicrobiota bacterium]